ncbi:mismatch repair ATPase MSH6 SCDLUD_001671 [Saccharomycodes ludwigii]|uniref:mismatch repair ATPase MSH6 n=1 Tax=Saccharomycodes ludwigii TaxID=36035 RepID=UPI001E8B65E8|nr:hypothetical protein SCDLUD_001671 [Saccharomycodes ludwigii]KAH3901887.1 hypothetical protein SCDLUD_001671 [Saccharomycodes ludwigii]
MTPSYLKHIKQTPPSSKKKLKQSTLLGFFSSSKKSGSSPSNRKQNFSSTNSTTTTDNNDKKSLKNNLFITGDNDDDDEEIQDTTETSFNNNATRNFHDSSPIKGNSTQNTTLNLVEPGDKSQFLNEETQNPRNKREVKKPISYAESENDDDDDDFETSFSNPRKRKRTIIPHDDDDGEYKPNSDKHNIDGNSTKLESSDDEDLFMVSQKIPQKKARNTSTAYPKIVNKSVLKAPSPNNKNKPTLKMKTSASSSSSSSNNNYKTLSNGTSATTEKAGYKGTTDTRYSWLTKSPRLDANKNSPDSPDFDPRTVFIPQTAWNKFTPFEEQYWKIKMNLMDCIVFFKKGKFYELYENDALLANQLFDLKIAGNGGRAGMVLAGIPEMSFDYWANQFIQHGYKVAKVDQAETLLAKEMREASLKSSSSSNKRSIVQRELKCVLTRGTLTEEGMLQSDLPTYCLSVKEDKDTDGNTTFGVSFVDTSTGEIYITQLNHDNDYSKLDTVLSQIRPHELVLERNNLSAAALKLIKFNSSPGAIYNYSKANTEFYDVQNTCENLRTKYDSIPTILSQYMEDSDKWVALNSFGGLLNYLQFLKLDKDLISMNKIMEYETFQKQGAANMVLDGITLQNLEIFANSFDGSDNGTFFKLVNRANTPMGKRLMRKWVMLPLFNKTDIENRLDSVDQLLQEIELRELVESVFSNIPDLERLVARVHSGSLKFKDFDGKVLPGFEKIVNFVDKLKNNFKLCGAFREYANRMPIELLKEQMEIWKKSYDKSKIINPAGETTIVLYPGVDKEFDDSVSKINTLHQELQEQLKKYKKMLGCNKIQFKDSGKELYTIEVPIQYTKKVPHNWTQLAANKSFKKYYSPEVERMARQMAEFKESHRMLEADLIGKLYQRFDQYMSKLWTPVIELIASMDCLLSLAKTSESIGIPCCRPKFLSDQKTGSMVNFKGLRHPFFNMGASTCKEFIPNDIKLGGENNNKLVLLTGANAAGKSTVLRMTCIAAIMSQIGCYVPCEEAELIPIDRIMTRLGANDNIMQGKSTFLVELSETKKILDMATNKSLLVIDELGRGGSSTDGFAIAESVLYHLATHIQSLGFFATHYGGLNFSFRSHPQVRSMKMSILCDENNKNVTFLYKLVDGCSEGSFGMHVANMCGIPREIVDNAINAADNFEQTSQLLKFLKNSSVHTDKGCDDNSLIPLGVESDFVRILKYGINNTEKGCGDGVKIYDDDVKRGALANIFKMIDELK